MLMMDLNILLIWLFKMLQVKQYIIFFFDNFFFYIGDGFRGATWVALHNGGGCGWGEVINGGFGLVLDGTEEAANKLKMMLSWDG